ncbi:MAG: ATP-binding protein [Pseudomonadota bacterium]
MQADAKCEEDIIAPERNVARSQSWALNRRKLEAIGALATGIAHEINSPIQYIENNIQFLEDAFQSLSDILQAHSELVAAEKQQSISSELIKTIESLEKKADLQFILEECPQAIRQSLEGINHVSHIVSAVKEFAHPGSEEKEESNVNNLLKMTSQLSKNEWKYHAEISYDLAEDIPDILCYPGELCQVWLNLIVNAAYALKVRNADTPGFIKISTQRCEQSIQITFIDNGVGIPQDIQHRVFDPFFTTKDIGEGSGQGLAICKNIIKNRHDGEICVTSEEGKGTGFVIRLPLNSENT